MVEYVDMVRSTKNRNKLQKRQVNISKKKSVRIQFWTDFNQFDKIQTFLKENENRDCNNESQALYKIVDNYFLLINEIDKWKKIALATMDTQDELEKKLKDQQTKREFVEGSNEKQ